MFYQQNEGKMEELINMIRNELNVYDMFGKMEDKNKTKRGLDKMDII